MEKKRYGKLFWKILISFITLLIPLVVVTCLFYTRATNQERDDTLASLRQSIFASVDTIDGSISTARSASLMFLDADIVNENIYSQNYDITDQRVNGIQLIKQIAYTRQIIGGISADTFLYYDSKKVYGDGSYDFGDYFGSIAVFDAYDVDFWTRLMKSNNSYTILPATVLCITPNTESEAVIPIVLSKTAGSTNAKMVLCLSVRKIASTLQLGIANETVTFTVLDSSGGVIYSNSPSSAENYVLTNWKNRNGIFSFRQDGTEYYGIGVLSNSMGWRYYALLPAAAVSNGANGIIWLLLVSIVMLVIGLLVAVRFSLSIYKPIFGIRQLLDSDATPSPEDDSPVKPGDDFDVIGHGVQNIIRKYSQASDENQEVISDFLDSSLMFLLNGQPIRKYDAIMRLLERDSRFSAGSSCCLCIRVDFQESFIRDVQDTERLDILSNLKAAICGIVSSSAPCYVLGYRENIYACIVNPDGRVPVSAIAETLAKSLGGFGSYSSVVIGFGNSVNSLEEIHQSFRRSFAAVSDCVLSDGTRIIDASEYSLNDNYYYQLQDENNLLGLLKSGKKEEACRCTDAILEENRRRGVSLDGMQLLAEEIYCTGIRFLTDGKASAPDVGRYEKLRFAPADMGSLSDVEEKLHGFFSDILQAPDGKEKDETSLSDVIETYVREHYSQDLYLEKIADNMGLSVKYISRVFKKNTGKNLTDFINEVRVDHVKQLLTETSLPVRDISEAVGIPSRSTFVRLFKKYTNVTPSEYRNIFG